MVTKVRLASPLDLSYLKGLRGIEQKKVRSLVGNEEHLSISPDDIEELATRMAALAGIKHTNPKNIVENVKIIINPEIQVRAGVRDHFIPRAKKGSQS